MNTDISIIIPVYNEGENIPGLFSRLNEFIADHNNLSFEVIFVDDGSTDNSCDKIFSNHLNSNFKLIKLSRNFGSHPALRAGILIAKGEYTTFTYADLQDPLELIIEMLNLCRKGSNIVWAARSKSKTGIKEKFFSKMYAKLMRIFVNPDFPANGFDVVMFDSKAKSELNKNIESNSSIFLQILNMGFKQDCTEYEKRERTAGNSKWTLSKKIKLFVDSFVAFSYMPIRLVTITGILLFLIGILWAMYIILRELIIGDLAPGWPTLISILMICFGVTNISLGIIAEYLWRTLDASRKRPVFIIDEVFEKRSNN